MFALDDVQQSIVSTNVYTYMYMDILYVGNFFKIAKLAVLYIYIFPLDVAHFSLLARVKSTIINQAEVSFFFVPILRNF